MQTITKLFRNTLTIATLILTISAINAAAATFTVTNNNDSGAGSLRDAITQANTNAQADTINFDAAFFNVPRTITLTTGELRITRDGSPGFEIGRLLTINGPGANLLTISGNNASRVFYVSTHGNLAMSGITVRDGNGVGTVLNNEGVSGGGMIAHVAYISLSNMTFRNNSVTGSSSGGAIYLSGIRSFTMTDSLVTENTAGYGGGIYDFGDTPVLTQRFFTNTTISNNTAANRSGGAFITGGTTTMTNCRITGNKAVSTLPAGGAASVGGLTLFGPATVTDTVISNNTAGIVPSAGYPNGVYGIIGGVNVDATSAVFRRVTVSGNSDHITGTAGGAGMQLRAAGGNTITIIDSLVSNNRHIAFTTPGAGPLPVTQGAGILSAGNISIINTTITGNVAENGYAGGIFNLANGLKIINSTITGNVAPYNDPNASEKGGGGIYNRSSSAQPSQFKTPSSPITRHRRDRMLKAHSSRTATI